MPAATSARPPTRRRCSRLVRFVPLLPACVVLVFGVVALLVERRPDRAPALTFGGVLETIVRRPRRPRRPVHLRAPLLREFFPARCSRSASSGLVVFAVLLFRPLAAPHPAHRGRLASTPTRLVHTYGWDTLAYFALRDDKSFFFSSDGEAMLAYTYLGGYALVSGDPIGAPRVDRRSCSTSSSRSATSGPGRRRFLAVREAEHAAVRLARVLGLLPGRRGDHRLPTGSPSRAAAMKSVRAAVRRVGRDHRFQLMRGVATPRPSWSTQLNAISERWRGKAPERGFTMSLSPGRRGRANPEFLLCVALDEDGTPGGFLRLVPAYGRDLRLHARPHAPRPGRARTA